MSSGSSDPQDTRWVYRLLAVGALSLLVFGTVVYHFLEGWSWVDSFYFCTVAVTTVGFGDLHPTSDASKLFTVFYIFTGISLVGAFLNERLKHRGWVARRARKAHRGESDGEEPESE
jgi:hypothetical protein